MVLNLKPACPTCTQPMLQSKSSGSAGSELDLVKWFCGHCNAWKTLNPAQIIKLKKS